MDSRYQQGHQIDLTVLGTDSRTVGASFSALNGRRMEIHVTEPLVLDSAVRLDFDDCMLLGEVYYCSRTHYGYSALIEVEHAVPKPSGLANLVTAIAREAGATVTDNLAVPASPIK